MKTDDVVLREMKRQAANQRTKLWGRLRRRADGYRKCARIAGRRGNKELCIAMGWKAAQVEWQACEAEAAARAVSTKQTR